MKELLIINDLCGFSTVATTAMMPILSYKGVPTKNLPTAIISNNLEYGKFAIHETTDYITQSFAIWKELGFHSDAIATGFMASERQAEIIAEYCREQAATGTAIAIASAKISASMAAVNFFISLLPPFSVVPFGGSFILAESP